VREIGVVALRESAHEPFVGALSDALEAVARTL